MNLLRRELIKAYFEAIWIQDKDENSLDHSITTSVISKLDKYLASNEEFKKVTLKGTGAYIECGEGMMPPIVFTVEGIGVKTGAELEISIETDKFCNIKGVDWYTVLS
jgi:hypothetical protein